jgi:hypothetical protein
VILDGPGEDGSAPAVAQHRFEKKCRGRLPVGSGDAAQLELRFGMSKKIRSDRSKGTAAMGYFDHRQIRVRRGGSKSI